MEAFADASYEEQVIYPRVLKSFHMYMLSAGKSEGTSKQYMRSFSALLSSDGKSLPDCASWDYHKVVKVSPRNQTGNGQMAASVKAFIEFWESEGQKLYHGVGEFATLTDKDHKLYWVRDKPSGAGPVAATKSQDKAEQVPAAKRRKAVDIGTVVAANGTEELVEEYDGFVLRGHGALWTVLPDDVVFLDIPAVAARTEATGWKCTSSDAARCTLSGAADITLYADAGKMQLRTSNKEVVLRAAQCLVNSWLVDSDC